MNLYHEPIGQLEDGRYGKYVRLNARDVDLNNRWKLSAVFETFQEIAGEQCNNLGFGWETMMTQYGYCFVIVRMHVEMDAYPGVNQVVRVETWPENKLRLIFTRYFRIIDQEDRVIGRAVSQWVLFDTKSRMVVKPQNCPIVQTPDTSSLEPPAVMPKRGAEPILDSEEVADTHLSDRIPAYSDFDYNRHVNNARYIEWVMDALPADCYGKNIVSLDIHYEHEIDFDTFMGTDQASASLSVTTKIFSAGDKFEVIACHPDGTRCYTCTGRFA